MMDSNTDGEKLLNEPGTGTRAYLLVCKWIGGLALLGLIGYPVVSAVNDRQQAASVDEIRAVIVDSACAKKMLADANSAGREITHRDLRKVSDLCEPVDRQSKAFN
jgi:hypothetical protein